MKHLNEEQALRAAMSLADEIKTIVEQSLFVDEQATEQTMQIVTFALCRVLGEVIGCAAVDRNATKKTVRSMEISIIGFAEQMREDMETARRMVP